jgi:hypothetical protein
MPSTQESRASRASRQESAIDVQDSVPGPAMEVTDEHLAILRQVMSEKVAWLSGLAEIREDSTSEQQALADKVHAAMTQQDAGLIDPVSLDHSAGSSGAEKEASSALQAGELLSELGQEAYEVQQASDYASEDPSPGLSGRHSPIRCPFFFML